MADATEVVQETLRPSLGEWWNGAAEILKGKIRGALPGRVDSYDAATQFAAVKPLLMALRRNEDGSITPESLGVINSVPVIMPQGGGFQVKLPIKAGDIVLLVFCDRSLDIWKSKGGEVDPLDHRSHHLSDAVAIPCIRDPAATAPVAKIEILPNGNLLLGDGAAQGVGLGQAISTALANIVTWLTTHTHTVPITGPAGTTPTAASLLAPPSIPTVESATVKTKT